MKINAKLVGAAMGALGMVAASGAAQAGSILAPGISTGLALGAPLPEGLFDVSILTWGSRSTTPATDLGAAAPAWLIWSTPWTVLGGRILFDVVTPVAHVAIGGPIGKSLVNASGMLDPLVDVMWKWNLGNGWNFGVQEGVYLPVNNGFTGLGVTAANNFATSQTVVAVSYLKDGWNLTATGIYGSGQNGRALAVNGSPAWFNYDLTAMKAFGKWEFGLIGYGSADVSAPYARYAKQSQFALGGIVAYHFGGIEVQLKYSHDVSQTNYGGYDSRVWTTFIVPLWVPEAPKAVAAKY